VSSIPDRHNGREQKEAFRTLFTTKAKGIGLGLVVTKSIVEAHKGSIAVEAGRKGTTFTVRLPIASGRMSMPGEHAKVLIVDDDENLCRTLGLS
jgi:K+-sensing histidine kinase KdpD